MLNTFTPDATQPQWVQYIHKLNDVLHQEPVATAVYGFFWFLLLLFSLPWLSFGIIFYTAYQVICFYYWKREVLPKEHPDKELAVVVTGCDSGFGKELVFSLVSKGFTVFAACLQEESFEEFKGEPKIIPIQVNITSDEDVAKAYETVFKWLDEDNKDNKKERYLHALVNNAGTGIGGLADWLEVKDFQNVMEVNFFGTIRCTKAFLPILKRQSASGSYSDGRIVNMISTAGIVAGGIFTVAYEASKHALDAYTINLRSELQAFGIKVTAVCPGMHKTPLAAGKNIAAGMKRVWDGLTPEAREEYGEDYFNALAGRMDHRIERFQWDKKYVVEAMDQAVVAGSPPARILVGLDAKYILYPFSKLPTWLRINFIRQKPAMMTKKEA